MLSSIFSVAQQFVFSPEIQAKIAAGTLEVMRSSSGTLLAIARDPITKKIVAHAVGVTANSALSPLLMPCQILTTVVTGAVQTAQIHKVNQSLRVVKQDLESLKLCVTALEASVGVLGATSAVLTVGVAAAVVLAAVSLWEIMKLHKNVQEMRIEMKDGFLDLKKVMANQGKEIIDHIDRVAADIKFEQHRVVLIRAYGKFIQANRLIQAALMCDDLSSRNDTLSNAQAMLASALADYRNPGLMSDLPAAARLRRFECCWAIEQALAMTFQLRGEYSAVYASTAQLQQEIRQAAVSLTEEATAEELSFLVPELLRIYNSDLSIISSWQDHADLVHSLPASELAEIDLSEISPEQAGEIYEPQPIDLKSKPIELVYYENLQDSTTSAAIRDGLRLTFRPELRSEMIHDLRQRAAASGHLSLNEENLSQISNQSLANLKHYLYETVSA